MKLDNDANIRQLMTKDFILLLMASFLVFTAMGVFYLFPLYVLSLGGSKADIGMLMGLMALSAVAVRPWVSVRVDQIGRKASLALGYFLIFVVSIAHLLLAGTLESLRVPLAALRFVYGVGIGFTIVAALTFATDLVPPPRLNEGIGYFGIVPLLGIAVGPLIGEAVQVKWGFAGMFAAAAGLSFLAGLFILPIKEHHRSAAGRKADGFFTVLKYPLVWRMAIIVLTFGIAFAAHGAFVAPFAASRALTVSLYFATYSAAAVISRFVGGRLAARFGETRIIPAALLLVGMGFVWLVQVDSNFGLVVTGLLAGAGHGLFFPSAMAFSVRSMDPGDRGKATGVITGGVDAGMLIGSFSLGQLGEVFGFSAIFAAAALFVLLGMGCFWMMRKGLLRLVA